MTRLKRRKELESANRNDVRFGTPELVAEYRATRLAALRPETIIEVGAGAGFQTQAFAKAAKQVVAIDIDAERLQRAAMPANAIAIAGDALDPAVIDAAKKHARGRIAIFLDPERPPAAAQRTLAEIRPDISEFLKAYSAISPDIAIELPPFLGSIPFDCEREFLSIDGKLNRLTIYTGALKRCDTSVVRLPDAARIEHNNADSAQAITKQRLDVQQPSDARQSPRHDAKFVLEPDAALSHAGLIREALDVPAREVSLGNRTVLLGPAQPKSSFFTAYKILAVGRQQVESMLPKVNCATVILHGQLSQEEQRDLLRRLNRLCRGKRRLHLFLAGEWYLAAKVQAA
jgi:hypothetical protein